MVNLRSDALVFFDATGDLAYKKIFPALQAMIKRGNLDIPVIGVANAGWNVEQLRARAKESLEKRGGQMEAYERVLGDAIAGDATLFARQDYVEEAWRIVDPVLKQGSPLHYYEPNSWGPSNSTNDWRRRVVGITPRRTYRNSTRCERMFKGEC